MDQLALVVEGDGEVQALPTVIRAHLHARQVFDLTPAKPINTKGRGNLLRVGEVERFTRLAAIQAGTIGVIVLCDADDDAACTLGPDIQARAETAAREVPVRATVAIRKFENWIVASAETVHGEALEGVHDYEGMAPDPIIKRWRAPRSYVKPIHQPRLAASIDLELAASRCPSLARLLRCVDELDAGRPDRESS